MPAADVFADSGHGLADHDQVIPQGRFGMRVLEDECGDVIARRDDVAETLAWVTRTQIRIPSRSTS